MDTSGYWDRVAWRRLRRRRVLRGGAVGVVGLAIAGCANTTAPAVAPTTAPAAPAAATRAPEGSGAAAPAATTAAPQPKLGGTIQTMTTSAERNLDPHASTGAAGGSIGALISYSGLLTYKWGPDVKPPSYIPTGDLAESWTQADDTTYIFKLRPGVKFHNKAPVNGRELVADDIVYSYNRVIALKNYAGFLAGVAKMEAADKSTFKLTLDKPNADILNNLAVYNLVIVAKERADQTGGDLGDLPQIGTGPFTVDSFTVNERLVMKRNPDYFIKGKPYTDGMEALRSVGDPSRMVSSFRAGAINFLMSGLTIQQAEDVKKAMPNAVVTYIPVDRAQVEFIINASNDLFKDVRVRQALNKAIDRKAIIDSVFSGRGRLSSGFSFPDASYQLPDAELTKLLGRDVEGAKKLLADAGKGSGLSFEILASTALSGSFVSAAEVMQANLKEVGVTATIKPADSPTYLTAQGNGNFQVSVAAFAQGAPGSALYSRYYTGGGQNYAKFSDPDLDKLIDQQAVLVKDEAARKKVLQDIQRKVIEDAVALPLVGYDSPMVFLPDTKGVYPPSIPTLHNTFWIDLWFDK
jgi:peptide/nickel transport system substrate-binding protein